MPLFLRRYCPSARVESVELEPLVVQSAVSHFGFPPPGSDANCSVHIADAAAFVAARSEQLLQQPGLDTGSANDPQSAIMVDLNGVGGHVAGYDAIMVDLYLLRQAPPAIVRYRPNPTPL
jgi:hypothetical protein